jgi:hypothetical protein
MGRIFRETSEEFEEERHYMDFNQAISVQVQWKSKLAQYIANPDKSLDSTKVSSDRNCDLGKWLYGDGQKFASLPEYATLTAEHARFHRAAGEVIKNADAGKNVSHDIQLGGDSEFSKASSAVVSKIMAIKGNAK